MSRSIADPHHAVSTSWRRAIALALLLASACEVSLEKSAEPGGDSRPLPSAVGAALPLLVHSFVGNVVTISGSSMEPTLNDGDRLWRDELSPRFAPLQRQEMATFALEQHGETTTIIKRIIGLPGDRIAVRGGTVYLSGHPLDEPYLSQPPGYDCPGQDCFFTSGGEIAVPPEAYFVLGDNRNHSVDSHVFGFLPASSLQGRMAHRLTPVERAGPVGSDLAAPRSFQAPAWRPVRVDEGRLELQFPARPEPEERTVEQSPVRFYRAYAGGLLYLLVHPARALDPPVSGDAVTATLTRAAETLLQEIGATMAHPEAVTRGELRCLRYRSSDDQPVALHGLNCHAAGRLYLLAVFAEPAAELEPLAAPFLDSARLAAAN
jgi:signal peptidase I